MPQILQVLRCYSCKTFQVHIVKKINKWECKMCGEKQSVKKVYGRGTGQDCRCHVQHLNMMSVKQREAYSMSHMGQEAHLLEESDKTTVKCHSPEKKITSDESESVSSNCSRWNKFLDYPLEERSDDGLQHSSSMMTFEVEGAKEECEEENTFNKQKSYDPFHSDLFNRQKIRYSKREILSSQQHKWQMFVKDDDDCSDHRNKAIIYSNLEVESDLSQTQNQMSIDSLKKGKCDKSCSPTHNNHLSKMWNNKDGFQNEQRENDLKGKASHSQSDQEFDFYKQWNHGNPFLNRIQRKLKSEERKTNLQLQKEKADEVQENKNGFFNSHCINLKEIKNNIQFEQGIKSNEMDGLWNGKDIPQDKKVEEFTGVDSAPQFWQKNIIGKPCNSCIGNASLNLQKNVTTDAASKDIGNNEILRKKSTFLSNLSFNSISTKSRIFIHPSSSPKLQRDYDEEELDKILSF